mmetsp:Transcript_18808/g.28168  ORF Transcript_18808/g.28168 Transcript_18808/m.28168 type:complete len:122 (-) Transcript_18808:807-1172(-)
MFGYNAMLCVYYTCAIASKMKEEQIARGVEPWLHIIPLVLGLAYAVPPLFTQMYNPTSHEAWCTIIARYDTTCRIHTTYFHFFMVDFFIFELVHLDDRFVTSTLFCIFTSPHHSAGNFGGA